MMKKKYLDINVGENNQFCKDRYMENLIRKITNSFWNCIDDLSCKITKIAILYEKVISKKYKKEGETSDISNGNNILHIGCGAYPITAITLAKLNGAKIVGIDNNQRIIEAAKNIINKKKLHEQITIEYGDGVDYPVESFNAIIVSGCSLPKIKILEHIFEGAKPQSKIIIREPSATTKSVIDCINMHQDIVLVNKMESNPFPFFGWQSFYLIKK